MATWTLLSTPGATGSRSVSSIQTTTDTAPTLSTDGLQLAGVAGFTVTIEADAGQTLTGVGSMQAYVYNDAVAAGAGGWSRSPDLDIAVPTGVNGSRRYGGVAFQVQSPRGRIAHITSGIGVSAGGVTVYMLASSLYGSDV